MSPVLTSSPAVSIGLDLGRTLSCLRVGVADPCWRTEVDGTWMWATRTPEGAVTLRFRPGEVDGVVDVETWGEGAEWAQRLLPGVLGVHDHPPAPAGDGPVATLLERYSGFRLARSARVVDAAIVGVCRRGVSSFEAGRSWSLLVDALGDDAPGPGDLRLPPAPRRVSAAEPYDLHVLGLEAHRADEVRRIASHGPRLELSVDDSAGAVVERLRGIAGLGADAVDHARSVALGAPDAIPVIDSHHRAAVVALLDRSRGDAVDTASLLEVHRPQRGRVVRLIGLSLEPAPKEPSRQARRPSRTGPHLGAAEEEPPPRPGPIRAGPNDP